MARGKRETFILNPHNPKDKVILDFLDKQFNRSEAIRDVLYNQVIKNDGNTITTVLPSYDNSIITPLPYNDNAITTSLPNDDNSITKVLQYDDNTFNIDLNSIDDEVIESKSEDEDKNANDAALDYLKNFR